MLKTRKISELAKFRFAKIFFLLFLVFTGCNEMYFSKYDSMHNWINNKTYQQQLHCI